jgi:hypothetical protein
VLLPIESLQEGGLCPKFSRGTPKMRAKGQRAFVEKRKKEPSAETARRQQEAREDVTVENGPDAA